MGVVGRLARAELYRVVHEGQFLFVLATIVALFQFMYMGGDYYSLKGFDALVKATVAVRVGCVILVVALSGGSSLAQDFEHRTFQSYVVSGASRSQMLLAKLVVLYLAELVLTLAFPVAYALLCCLLNGGWGSVGWGGRQFDASSFLPYALAVVSSVLACASVSGLVAVLTGRVRATLACVGGIIGTQWLLSMGGLVATPALSWLPLMALDWASSGQVPETLSCLVGVVWLCACMAGSMAAVKRRE